MFVIFYIFRKEIEIRLRLFDKIHCRVIFLICLKLLVIIGLI